MLLFNLSGCSIDSSRRCITPFTERFDVLVHDQRGLGRAAPPTPWSMADYAHDALALLDHLGCDTCRIIGTASAAWSLRSSR